MPQTVDLHIHTTASDGQYSPSAIVEMAKAAGLACIAITDHDTMGGLAEAMAAGRRAGLRVIPGVELSAEEYPTFHILGYGVSPESPPLRALCDRMLNSRDERKYKIIEYLRGKGISLDLAEVEAVAGSDLIARPHFAQVMVRRGYVATNREAFDRYLDTEEYRQTVIRVRPPWRECITTIHAAGGKASLAHPYQIELPDDALKALVAEMAAFGLDAIECYYPKYTPEMQGFYLRLAEEYQLHITAGSDFHGEKVKPDVALMPTELDLDWLPER